MDAHYRTDLNRRYWQYQQTHFPDWVGFLEHPQGLPDRPPVFIPSESWRNVILDPDANQKDIDDLLALIPDGEKHIWFRSMNSSQALTQSVFGNLKTYTLLHELSELKDDDGLDLFGNVELSSDNFSLEHRVDHLGEPRPTSLDGYFYGDYQIAIECKFTETEIGTCSRPRLKPADKEYERQFCDGTYTTQKSRTERCSLSEIRIQYWHYVPELFNWKNDRDFNPCPLNKNYQLVRNLLAVGVKPNGTVSVNNGHVVLIYDERNPAFQIGGNGFLSYQESKRELKNPEMLRKCSWQRIVNLMREKNRLPWLINQLKLKYGF